MLLVGLTALPAIGQTNYDFSPEDRTFLERMALAQARADLLKQVYRLELAEGLTIEAWAARSMSRNRSLRVWVRTRSSHGAARLYSDATCDMDVRLEPRTLREQIEHLRQAHSTPGAEPIKLRDLRQSAARWPTLWGSGTAALTERSRSLKPEGWDDVLVDGVEITRRAAESDARQALLETVAELPVTSDRRLREFLDSSSAVRDAVLAAIKQKAEVKVSFEFDWVAVADARLSLLDLIRMLTDVHQRHYEGDVFHAADFRGMALLTSTSEISATGLASPSDEMILHARYQPIELDTPAWAAKTLIAVGRYEPDDEEQLDQLARAEAARIDGIDRLRRKVELLVIQQDVTVAAFLGLHDELKDDVIIFLSGARAVSEPKTLAGGIIEVPVELPLQRLWWIVRRGMRRIEVDLPEGLATQPVQKSTP